MELTEKRAMELYKILNANPVQAKELLTLTPQEAVAKLNGLGHHFTVEELQEYGQAVRTAHGNMSDDELEAVSGGVGRDNTQRIMSVIPLPDFILPIEIHPPDFTDPITMKPLPISYVKW